MRTETFSSRTFKMRWLKKHGLSRLVLKTLNYKIVGQWDKTHLNQCFHIFSLSHLLSHFNGPWDKNPANLKIFDFGRRAFSVEIVHLRRASSGQIL